MGWRRFVAFAKQVYDGYSRDRVPSLAAALAYYTVFSLAPLLVIVVSIAGLVFGEKAAAGLIVEQIRHWVGDEKTATLVQDMIAGAGKKSSSIVATAISIVVLLWGASRVFVHLHEALNIVWDYKSASHAAVHAIRSRFISFLMVLSSGFILLASLLFSASLGATFGYLGNLAGSLDLLWRLLDLVLGHGMTLLIFAMVFKWVPDARVAWGDVWPGALMTTVFYTLGRKLLGLYLDWGFLGSVYGTASSLVIVLFWVFYSSQILFLGAEVTWAFARHYGSHRDGLKD
jgi:membrane protein